DFARVRTRGAVRRSTGIPATAARAGAADGTRGASGVVHRPAAKAMGGTRAPARGGRGSGRDPSATPAIPAQEPSPQAPRAPRGHGQAVVRRGPPGAGA